MQHGWEGALPAFLLENAGHVVVGFARMDHQRQSGLSRGGDMGTETLFLRFARRLVVVIIESGLADRDNFWVARFLNQFGRGNAAKGFESGVTSIKVKRHNDAAEIEYNCLYHLRVRIC